MLKVLEKSIQYFPGEDLVDFPLFFPDFSLIKTEVVSIPCNNGSHATYENWRQSYSLEEEVNMVEKAIEKAKNGHRIHIRWITLSDSVKMLSEYYWEKWYENENKHFEIPATELLTVSVFFGNFLWSEKDKVFLEKRFRDDSEYIRNVTPVMTSHDLRIIQQGVRSGLLPLLEIHPSDTLYISQCVSREIIALYDLGQRITFSWKNMWFFPQFYERETDREHIFFELPRSTFGIQN